MRPDLQGILVFLILLAHLYPILMLTSIQQIEGTWQFYSSDLTTPIDKKVFIKAEPGNKLAFTTITTDSCVQYKTPSSYCSSCEGQSSSSYFDTSQYCGINAFECYWPDGPNKGKQEYLSNPSYSLASVDPTDITATRSSSYNEIELVGCEHGESRHRDYIRFPGDSKHTIYYPKLRPLDASKFAAQCASQSPVVGTCGVNSIAPTSWKQSVCEALNSPASLSGGTSKKTCPSDNWAKGFENHNTAGVEEDQSPIGLAYILDAQLLSSNVVRLQNVVNWVFTNDNVMSASGVDAPANVDADFFGLGPRCIWPGLPNAAGGIPSGSDKYDGIRIPGLPLKNGGCDTYNDFFEPKGQYQKVDLVLKRVSDSGSNPAPGPAPQATPSAFPTPFPSPFPTPGADGSTPFPTRFPTPMMVGGTTFPTPFPTQGVDGSTPFPTAFPTPLTDGSNPFSPTPNAFPTPSSAGGIFGGLSNGNQAGGSSSAAGSSGGAASASRYWDDDDDDDSKNSGGNGAAIGAAVGGVVGAGALAALAVFDYKTNRLGFMKGLGMGGSSPAAAATTTTNQAEMANPTQVSNPALQEGDEVAAI